jgi:hypothetical protein
VQAVAQQTPSTQCPEVQSVEATQPAPSSFLGRVPQLPFKHCRPVTQSVSILHVEPQAAAVASQA